MECPRCKLINPDAAQRCDCGYDFESETVNVPYTLDKPPYSLYLFGVWACFWFGIVAFLVVGEDGPSRSIAFIAWVAIVFPLYYQIIVRKRRWAKTLLAVLTMPWGVWLLTSQEVRVFLLQPTVPEAIKLGRENAQRLRESLAKEEPSKNLDANLRG